MFDIDGKTPEYVTIRIAFPDGKEVPFEHCKLGLAQEFVEKVELLRDKGPGIKLTHGKYCTVEFPSDSFVVYLDGPTDIPDTPLRRNSILSRIRRSLGMG